MDPHEPIAGTAVQQFKVRRRVAFHETDAAGIVHFATYFIWMEQAEHALLHHLGIGVFMELDGERVSWPRVSAQCDFQNPLHFEDEFEVLVQVTHLGKSSVRFRFDFSRGCDPIATGSTTAVCCRLLPRPASVPIPPHLRAAF
ncbi:MAG: thioesterase family protein, partial [Planctomycetota bacterium]|nr:thioesterase family protein [Planctomycetota bacterium]